MGTYQENETKIKLLIWSTFTFSGLSTRLKVIRWIRNKLFKIAFPNWLLYGDLTSRLSYYMLSIHMCIYVM